MPMEEIMKTNKLVKLGIATFAVAVLGVVPAFTAQADTHVAEQPNTAQADTNVAEQPNTASKPVENGKPSDSEKPEVKPVEEVKPEAKSTANVAETQPAATPGGDATLKEEKHLPIRYVIELHFKHIGIAGEVEPTKTLTGTVNFGEDLTIDAPTFEGYRLERAYPKILNISYDNLNNFGKTAGSEVYEIDETSKDREYTLTKEGDTIIAHRRLQYETLPLEKPNRSERTLHINFSYTETPKIWPDGTRPLRRKYHSIDDGKRGITVTIKPGESFTLPKGEIDGYILEDITDSRHEEGRWGATTGNHYKPGETVPYEKFNFYPAVVDGVESDHISVSYSYYRPEKPSQPTEKPAPKADENQEPIKYRIDYFDTDTGERLSREIGVLNPGETINIHKNIDGYEVVTNRRWMSGYNVDYRLMDRYFGSSSGYRYMFLEYKKVNADAKPSETPKPEVKPETKPSETPKPEVKPEPAPKADENQEPINYLIEYFDAETGERISRKYGVLKPGETVNIHKNIDGYEVVSNDSWMPGYIVDYRIMSRYFGGQTFERYMFLDYKKVKADAKPSETPKPAPKDEEKQEPLKYRIDYFDADTGKEISREYGVLNPGETINIYKDIEGYEVVSYYSWMPGYKVDYRIMSTYSGGTTFEHYMFLRYKKVNADAKPSETLKPEVKPETKPSDISKPEVKPETKPSETPKPEVKPETKPSETPKPGVKPEPKPSETPKPEVKPETKPSDTPKPVTPAVPDQPQPAKPEKPVTPSTSRVLSNEAGSVQVRGSESTLKNVSYIKVEETKAKSLETKSYKAYDIHLYDANGKAIQPNGMVLVTLSADKPVENVYYVAPDGALQALDFKQDADKVTFETNHFSIYAMTFKNIAANRNDSSIQMPIAVVGGENTTTTGQNSNGADTTKAQATPLNTKTEGGSKVLPNTGEQNSILGFAGFLLASLGLAGLTYKGRH